VVSRSPAAGAIQVPVDSTVTVTFSEPMASPTFTATTFTLSDGGAVAGAVTATGATATFVPAGPLASGATYTATISATVTSLTGTSLGAPVTWSFSTAAASGGWWVPPQGTSWQWQLSSPPTASFLAVGMYDVDLFDTDASVVAALHAQGSRVVCYLSAGTYEPGRPDSSQFPDGSAAFGGVNVLGSAVTGWPGERWLDIRSPALRPVMAARLDLCRSKGFDAVEPDNVDGYANPSGWPLSAADQLAYNGWLADQAHQRGLSVALKNDLDQVLGLVGAFDWALNEQCFEYSECDLLSPFIAAGKAVFNVEYNRTTAQFCPGSGGACVRKFSSMQKHLALDAWRDPCVCP
jgi:hypothetical protein